MNLRKPFNVINTRGAEQVVNMWTNCIVQRTTLALASLARHRWTRPHRAGEEMAPHRGAATPRFASARFAEKRHLHLDSANTRAYGSHGSCRISASTMLRWRPVLHQSKNSHRAHAPVNWPVIGTAGTSSHDWTCAFNAAKRRASTSALSFHWASCAGVRWVVSNSKRACSDPHSAYLTPWSRHLRTGSDGNNDTSIPLT